MRHWIRSASSPYQAFLLLIGLSFFAPTLDAQEAGAQEDGAQEDGAQEDGAQEDGAQEDGAQEDGAQEDPDKSAANDEVTTVVDNPLRPYWTIQVDPLTTLLGYVHVQIEQQVTPYASIYVGPHLRLFSNPLSEPEPYLGFGIEVGVRIFPFGESPAGPWVMVRGVGAYLVTLDDSAAPTVGGYVSALGGYTWIFWDHFLLSGGLGGQYIHYRIGDYGPNTFFPALHTAFGVAF